MQMLVLVPFIFTINDGDLVQSPKRIISGMPAITEMLYALDLGSNIVGVTTNCNYPPEARKVEKVGGFTLNIEKIISLKPDLIILQGDAQAPEVEKLKKYGLPLYVINPITIDDVLACLLGIGKKTGKSERAERLVWRIKGQLRRARPHDLKSLLGQPKVLVVVGMNPMVMAGGGSFIDDIVKYAGGINIAQGAKGAYPQYSYEMLLNEKPDLIVVPKTLAVKEQWIGYKGRILAVDGDILLRPGPRVGDAVEQIAGAINGKK